LEASPGLIVHETLSQKKKKKITKRAGGIVQGVGPEFKLQYHKNKQKYKNIQGIKSDSSVIG
jgi:hypothetical protein